MLLWFYPRHLIFQHLNMTDNDGQTALTHAVMVNQSQCEEVLRRVIASSSYTTSCPGPGGFATPSRR